MKSTILLLLAILTAGHLHASDLHFIQIVEEYEQNADINPAVRTVRKHLDEEIGYIISNCGFSLKEMRVPNPLTGRSVLAAIQGLHVTPDDAVIFYYFGHGGRFNANEHPLPHGYMNEEGVFRRSRAANDLLNIPEISRLLRAKLPRFGLLIADCCNEDFGADIPEGYGPIRSLSRTHKSPELYKTLFTQQNGFIEVSATSRGQYAWYDNYYGSYFLGSLKKALDFHSAQPSAGRTNWEAIFDTTQQRLNRKLNDTNATSPMTIYRNRIDLGNVTRHGSDHQQLNALGKVVFYTANHEQLFCKRGGDLIRLSNGNPQKVGNWFPANSANLEAVLDIQDVGSIISDRYYLRKDGILEVSDFGERVEVGEWYDF